MPPTQDKAVLEGLVSRYWFALVQRGVTLLESRAAAVEVARDSLAHLAAQLEPDSESNEWLETLYRHHTELCLQRLTGRKGRDTQWLGRLENQGEGAEEEARRRAERDRLLDLLNRTAVNRRPSVVMRYLEQLGIDSIARLTGQTREQAVAQLEGFQTTANAFLQGRGDEALEAPATSDCPDAFALYRLLAGEREGLDEVRAHLEDHPACAQRLQALEEARDEAAAEADVAGIAQGVAQAIERIQRRRPAERRGLRQLLAPALAAALVVGLIAWLSWPDASVPADNPIVVQKGFSLEAFVAGDADAEALVDGEQVPAGTELRFRLGAAVPMWARLSALRERGPVQAIGPAEQLSFSLQPGQLSDIPTHYELGPNPGLERIFALFCPLGGPMAYFNQGLTYAFQPGLDGKRDLARAYSSAPRNCQLRSLVLVKTSSAASPDEHHER